MDDDMDDMDDFDDFEYDEEDEEDEEDDDSPDVLMENTYYNSKSLLETEPKEALSGFRTVIMTEPVNGEWGFKSLKQIVKILFDMGDHEGMIEAYQEMLGYIANTSAVSRARSEKCINSLLDYISGSKMDAFLEKVYRRTLDALKVVQNDRLLFKTTLKLGLLLFETRQFDKLPPLLKDLKESCEFRDGLGDVKSGTQMLEVYALEIQYYSETKNNTKLKEIYEKATKIKSAVPHPRVLGVIMECGGKMHMKTKNWDEARTSFFDSFRNYDECGSPRRINCLKYLILSNLLAGVKIDPFDSQEVKPYRDHPEVKEINDMTLAYEQSNIEEFERILHSKGSSILSDPFIQEYVDDLLKKTRLQALFSLIRPYKRINFAYIADKLNTNVEEVENLLITTILDGDICGKLDQEKGLLLLGGSLQNQVYPVAERVAKQLNDLHRRISGNMV